MSSLNYFDETVMVSLKMSKTLLEAIDRYAMNNGMTRSEVIRKALVEFLYEEEKKQ